MFEIFWEFVVKEKVKGQFELIFGPGGAWSNIFARSPGFRGTTLLHDTKNSHRYLIVDIWDTIEQRDEAIINHLAEYEELQNTFDTWVDAKTELGIYRIQGKSSVRPFAKKGTSTTRKTRHYR